VPNCTAKAALNSFITAIHANDAAQAAPHEMKAWMRSLEREAAMVFKR
jgi:hypothetical protein